MNFLELKSRKKELANQDYKITVDAAKAIKLIINCKQCSSREEKCLQCITNILSKESNACEIVIENYIEREYFGAAVKILKKIVELRELFLEFSARKDKKCSKCRLSNENFKTLADALPDNFECFWAIILDSARALNEVRTAVQKCKDCKERFSANLVHAIKKFAELAKFIKFEAYRVITHENEDNEKSMENFDIDTDKLASEVPIFKQGVERILDLNVRLKPCFSSFWLTANINSSYELVKEYYLDSCKIALYSLPESTEDLYYIMPAEYKMPAQYIKLIDLALENLDIYFHKDKVLSTAEDAKNHIAEIGAKLIRELARKRGVYIGSTDSEELEQAKFLASILAKYTAGLGVLEVLLKDYRVQDVFIDAPSENHQIYLTISNNQEPKLRTRVVTNIKLTSFESESLLSRFRYEAGRPFSETLPVLECDLDTYTTRATVVGKPLSPNGIAFALRRHSYEPWTLLRFIHNKTLSSLAAGLLSFLLDGNSAMLVAGSRAAGKTSLLSAIMLEFPQSQRILTIEDTLELPTNIMQCLGYKVQALLTKSCIGNTTELNADEALRVALRLGESAIVIGEVRGNEAKTLYESMRTGVASSTVLGTIHGNSAKAVYERVVYDLSISPYSFSATDIVIIINLIRPQGSRRTFRRVTQIAEFSKSRPEEGIFQDLMTYDYDCDELKPTNYFLESSDKLKSIGHTWGMSYEEILLNINARAEIRKTIVELAEQTNNYELLNAKFVAASNNAYWNIIENHMHTNNRLEYNKIIKEWKEWCLCNLEYV